MNRNSHRWVPTCCQDSNGVVLLSLNQLHTYFWKMRHSHVVDPDWDAGLVASFPLFSVFWFIYYLRGPDACTRLQPLWVRPQHDRGPVGLANLLSFPPQAEFARFICMRCILSSAISSRVRTHCPVHPYLPTARLRRFYGLRIHFCGQRSSKFVTWRISMIIL